MTDAWSFDDTFEATPPCLYLPHVPPALVCQAEDTWIADPELLATNVDLCVQYRDETYLVTANNSFEAIHKERVFDVAIRNLFEHPESVRREECLEFVRELLHNFDLAQKGIPVPSSIREEADAMVGQVLRLEVMDCHALICASRRSTNWTRSLMCSSRVMRLGIRRSLTTNMTNSSLIRCLWTRMSKLDVTLKILELIVRVSFATISQSARKIASWKPLTWNVFPKDAKEGSNLPKAIIDSTGWLLFASM